jgi:hypothetical protein
LNWNGDIAHLNAENRGLNGSALLVRTHSRQPHRDHGSPRGPTPTPGVLQKSLQIVDFAGDNFFGSAKEAANYYKQIV